MSSLAVVGSLVFFKSGSLAATVLCFSLFDFIIPPGAGLIQAATVFAKKMIRFLIIYGNNFCLVVVPAVLFLVCCVNKFCFKKSPAAAFA